MNNTSVRVNIIGSQQLNNTIPDSFLAGILILPFKKTSF